MHHYLYSAYLAAIKYKLHVYTLLYIMLHTTGNIKKFKKLQILPLTSQYMLSLLMFVVQNKNLFLTYNENHNLDTRQRNNLYLPQTNLTIYQTGAFYLGIKIFNNLPLEVKNVDGNQKKKRN